MNVYSVVIPGPSCRYLAVNFRAGVSPVAVRKRLRQR